jgi:Transglycosylase SLT domain
MKRTKLLISLIAAAGLTAGLGGSILPAAAARTVTVTLTTGQVLSASGDIPCDASAVGAPANLVASVQCADLPTVTTPPVTQPQQSNPPSNSTPSQTTPTQTTGPQSPGTNKPPTKRTKHRPGKPTPSTTLGAPSVENSAGPATQSPAQTRSVNGAPTPANPSFSLALPGPAAIGVPNFFIDNFRIPPFLLPIYQAAGIQYGVQWQVLAAINEIETDYGRNLSVSSAGAMGWMQFIPSSWRTYGVDANGDGRKDPYNPVDAIFAAARYLHAAGASKDIRSAIFSYNHATWYVDSVMLRAKLIGGLPDALVGAITGLTQGRFPVAARATYADDISDRQALKRAHSGNVANVVGATSSRRSINVYSKVGAPVVAVQDGVVKAMGQNSKLGRYLVLQDAYGNTYTYAQLGKLATSYPAPKPQRVTAAQVHTELELPPKDKAPTQPASAGAQPQAAAKTGAASPSQTTVQVTKERLFAHPDRTSALSFGGRQQLLQTGKPVAGYTTFESYFQSVLGLNGKDVVLRPLKPGAQVIGGTVLGRIDRTDPALAPHLSFEIRPAGKGAPAIDPKPILDGWKLLEATAIYRAAGKNPFFGPNAKNPTIGQILLMSKEQLVQRVLGDPRIDIYACGRQDIQSGQIDRRVMATLEFLAAQGLKPTVSALKCGHSFYVKGGGMVSEHSYGDAVDIAAVNGIPIIGHQGKGSITDITIRRLLTLQGTMKPHQIISLMTYPGTDNTLSLADHNDHIHVGFYPLYGENAKLSQQVNAVLKPGQWVKLISRLNQIDNPVVPTKPSAASIPAGRSSGAHAGD